MITFLLLLFILLAIGILVILYYYVVKPVEEEKEIKKIEKLQEQWEEDRILTRQKAEKYNKKPL